MTNSYGQARFVYVVKSTAPNSVAAFSVNPNGSLTEIAGSPFVTGGSGGFVEFITPNPITSVRAGSLLFVANDSGISAFKINPTTGSLTPVPGSPFSTIPFFGQYSLTASPDGRFLFASLIRVVEGSILVFRIEQNGSLTPVPGSPFPTTSGTFRIQVSPNNQLLAVGHPFGNKISIYRIAQNGSLTLAPGSPLQVGDISAAEFNCSSNLLFATEAGNATKIHVFNVDSNGGLAPISGSPFSGPGNASEALVLSPDERNLFVTTIDNSVISFNVASNGSLSVVPGSPFLTGVEGFEHAPTQLAINEKGTFLYVSNRGGSVFTDRAGSVSVFSIASNGVLSLIPASPFSTGPSGDLVSLAAYPPKSCEPIFDICLQDDSNGSLLRIDSTTGKYEFANCSGMTVGGTGSLIKKGSLITLQHNASDRRVSASLDTGISKGTASIQLLVEKRTFSITDRNTANNTCTCSTR